MEVFEAIRTRRSIRKYINDRPILDTHMKALAEIAVLYPCPGNRQPLKVIATNNPRLCDTIFHTVRWAMYINGYEIPQEHRSVGYLIILGDKTIANNFEFCAGALMMQLMLGAQALGLSTCCLGIAEKEDLINALELDPERYSALYVLTLGYSDQKSSVIAMEQDFKYQLDGDGNFLVPKRRVDEVVRFL